MAYKPNLIPNNKNGFDPFQEILENYDIKDYVVTEKLDGVQLVLHNGEVLGRSLKKPGSKHVTQKFKKFSEYLQSKGVTVNGEFYSEKFNFTIINRFFRTTDVTSPAKKRQLQNLYNSDVEEYKSSYGEFTPEELSTNDPSFRMYIFDCYVHDKPDMPYMDRMSFLGGIVRDIRKNHSEFMNLFNFVRMIFPVNIEDPKEIVDHYRAEYQSILNKDGEGLVLSRKDRVYKLNRSTIKEGTYFKVKPNNEWDGIVVRINEGTRIREGVVREINELGRSVTSKRQEDREPNGKAASITTLYEGKEVKVMLEGFTDTDKYDMLMNRNSYIGKSFTYVGMPPLKNVPRHAKFKKWNDD